MYYNPEIENQKNQTLSRDDESSDNMEFSSEKQNMQNMHMDTCENCMYFSPKQGCMMHSQQNMMDDPPMDNDPPPMGRPFMHGQFMQRPFFHRPFFPGAFLFNPFFFPQHHIHHHYHHNGY